MFRMDLHIDDAPALEYIKTTFPLPALARGGGEWVWDLFITFLAIGAATKSAIFTIFSREDISIILAIFSKYSLNSSKHLNFLAFAKANPPP